MKRFLILLSLLSAFLLHTQISYSQANTYFQNNPEWTVTSSCGEFFPCIENENYNYYINGDSIHNSLVYKKVFRKGLGSYLWLAPPPPVGCSGNYSFNDTLFTYLLRSSGKQMYIKIPSDPNEYLLYDFDLSIGDTLPLSYNNYETDITVTAIDSVYTPYGYLERFTLAGSSWSQYLIEGIGHSKGLLEPINQSLECGYELTCYSLNDTAYYPAIGPSCDIQVGLDEVTSKFDHSIFPNPFNSTTTLHLNTFVRGAELKIIDVHGKNVLQVNNITGTDVVIQRGNILNGIYFYTLRDGNNYSATGKLIVN